MAGGARIPFDLLPGYKRWGASLGSLLAAEAPLWIYGEVGSGVSFLVSWLAAARGVESLDDAESAGDLEAWIRLHPMGVLGSHRTPEDPATASSAGRCVLLRLLSLDEDPAAMGDCLEALAGIEGVAGPFPPELLALPCPGNLRGLRNRLLRWKLLGQLPGEAALEGSGPLPLDAEDLATNLHVLERLLLHRALRRSYGNRVEAARRLGVSRRQLYLLVARHGDPVRGEAPSAEGPKRLMRLRQNSSPGGDHR